MLHDGIVFIFHTNIPASIAMLRQTLVGDWMSVSGVIGGCSLLRPAFHLYYCPYIYFRSLVIKRLPWRNFRKEVVGNKCCRFCSTFFYSLSYTVLEKVNSSSFIFLKDVQTLPTFLLNPPSCSTRALITDVLVTF